jgi:hypothetical protein
MRILVAAALAGCEFTAPPASSSDALGGDAIDTPEPTAWLPGYEFRKQLDVTTGVAHANHTAETFLVIGAEETR